MVQRVVDMCVRGRGIGEYVTRFMNHIVDYLRAPVTQFPGPMRKLLMIMIPVSPNTRLAKFSSS